MNSTYQNDWIEIHGVTNDQYGNEIDELLAYLTNGSSDAAWRHFYAVEKGCLRITLSASSGNKFNGFMAEITLFPITPFCKFNTVVLSFTNFYYNEYLNR